MDITISMSQFRKFLEAYYKNEHTDDPIVNWMVDCLTDSYEPYDKELYEKELKAWRRS